MPCRTNIQSTVVPAGWFLPIGLPVPLTASIRSRATTAHSRLGIHLDLVDHFSLHQIFQNPAQVRQVDPKHRRAETLAIAQDDDLLIGMLMHQTIDQVNLSADGPLASRRHGVDLLDDVRRAAGRVGFLDHFPLAFGVDDHLHLRIFGPDLVHVFGAEKLVN